MNLLTVILVLIAIESGGDDRKRGLQGEIGCLQIKTIVVDDINQNILHRNHFTYADRYDRAKSVEMCQIYLAFYGAKVTGTLTEQQLARIWNGGPEGYRKPDTFPYWEKYRVEKRKQAP